MLFGLYTKVNLKGKKIPHTGDHSISQNVQIMALIPKQINKKKKIPLFVELFAITVFVMVLFVTVVFNGVFFALLIVLAVVVIIIIIIIIR